LIEKTYFFDTASGKIPEKRQDKTPQYLFMTSLTLKVKWFISDTKKFVVLT
jgi:hypothetical protein